MDKKKLTSKELLDLEKKMYEYQGDDRIISSHELAKELNETKDVVLDFETGIPSMDRILENIEAGELTVVTGPSGEGKSIARGTKVLMFSGLYKKIEDVQVGDKLMGKDSTPRTVLSLGNGKEEMFRVTPKRGMSFVCNKSHVLSVQKVTPKNVRKTIKGRRVKVKNWTEYKETTIHLEDYLKLSDYQKSNILLYRVPVKFKHKDVYLDPYFIGLWLGDGNSTDQRITTKDKEIVLYLRSLSNKLGLRLSKIEQLNNKSSVYGCVGKKGDPNILRNGLWNYNLINNKHIPHIYKTNSCEIRLEILAGLIDSDGYVNNGGYVFVNKNKRLAEDFLFVARSLGFYAYMREFQGKIKDRDFIGKYWKVGISGDCSVVPVKIKRKKVSKRKVNKNILFTGIKSIQSLGRGEYYGVTLDSDHEYLLEDFTVTHNTTLMMTITNNMVKNDIKSVWFTLEVTPRQFIKKMVTMQVDTDELPLFYMPRQNVDNQISWLEERIVEAIVKYDCKVIFIDHLHQIFDLMRVGGNMSLEIGALANKIKDIAVKNNIAIFLVVHNRNNTQQPNAEIRKEDLRDSGLIERAADTIIGVWRVKTGDTSPKKRPNDLDENDNWAKVKVLKNRGEGTMGWWLMSHVNHYLQEIVNPVDEENDSNW